MASVQCGTYDPNTKTKICCKRAIFLINDNTSNKQICCRNHLKQTIHTYFPDNLDNVKVSKHTYSSYLDPYESHVIYKNMNSYILEKN